MNVEVIKKNNNLDFFCKIQLTKKETACILNALKGTNCKGNDLTISLQLEDKIRTILNNK